MSYVELHCHSTFSLLDGAAHPEQLIARAVELKMPALALTDHEDLGGAVRFSEAAESAGFKGIIGTELTVEIPASAARCTPHAPSLSATHLVLLAQNREGYGNLCSLITRARMDHPRGRPRVTLDTLAAHATGLFALTACRNGWIPRLLARGETAAAQNAAATLSDIFEKRIAIECWDHSLPEERALIPGLHHIANTLHLPWVITNDVHYLTPSGRRIHDVLCALKHGATLDEMGTKLRPNAEWYLKGYEQMARRWRGHEAGLQATLAIAEQCAFRLRDVRPALPQFPLPHGVSGEEYLAQLVEQGACERWGWRRTAQHDKQIAHELALITKLGLTGYFLIVWDIVQFARRDGVLCQGRGSAANSAVCFVLGITAVDPIKLGLLFERFLSEERREAPDIDIDFAHRDRERVLQYVYRRYGRAHAAMVCEHITWRRRSAVRDAARVLGFSPEQIEVLESFHDRSTTPAPVTAARMPGLDPDDPRVQHLTTIVAGLREAPRQRSIHVGGFVLTHEPLHTVVPIEPSAMDDRTIIQWEKDDLDAAGLVKIDLLGLGMLTVLQDCIKYIRVARGVTIDLGQLEMTDQAVYDDLCRADTVSIFQVESRAQMNTLPRLKPRTFYDLAIEVALIRPGPLQGDMVNPYLRRRSGVEKIEYLHPSLEPILKRTLGVPLFQEQGMQVAVTAAGFTPGEADVLRKAMGHKRSREKMEAIRQRMIDGMAKNGIAGVDAERIFNQINGFADYGFPESHAASFALIVYASAYLRHYYAAEFLCATLNAQPMGFYAAGTLVEDARRHGVCIAPVDLTRSAWDHTLECADGTVVVPNDGVISVRVAAVDNPAKAATPARKAPVVRLGLRSIRGLGSHARKKLEAALAGAAFTSIHDFVARSQLDRRALRFVAESGALDAFVSDEPPDRRRRVALWRVLEAERGSAGPLALFPETPVPAGLPPLSAPEITEADYRMIGLSLNGHPMKHLRKLLDPNGVLTVRATEQGKDGDRVGTAGLVICRQRPATAKGFVFLTLEDETGMLNVVVTPKRFEQQSQLITRNPLLLVRGTLQVEQGVVNLRGEEFIALGAQAGAAHARSHDFR